MTLEMKKIGDFVSLRQGLAINKGTAHLVSDNKTENYIYPLLRIADMLDGSFHKYISRNVQPSVIARPEDIIYTRTGQIGLAFRGFNGCVHNNSFIVSLESNEITKDYLFVILQSDFVRSQALSMAKNSVQPDLTHGMFKNIVIPIPDLESQKKIVDIYLQLENKIRLNSKIIETSEKLMREIYDYWFVQFDFPDENGRPYKSSGGEMVHDETLKREIPKGWRVLELGDIIKEAKKSSVQVSGAREKVGAYPFFTSGDEILDFDEYYVDGFNIFLNTGGNADIKSYYGKSAYSTDTWCISADEYSYMLFIFLDSIKEQINNNCFAGSGLKHLQKNAFKKIKIVAPDDNLLRAFNGLAQSSHQAISSYKAENKKLTSLRDWLLPMLMNGQIKVSD